MIEYTNYYPITKIQQKIMRYIDYWAHTEITPISQKKILEEMKTKNENKRTVEYALNGLLKLGYIRRAITNGTGEGGKGSEKTKYVQLRRI